MKRRPFNLILAANEVAMISECEGAFVIEPMRFLWPSEARTSYRRSEAQKRTWREYKEWKAKQ